MTPAPQNHHSSPATKITFYGWSTKSVSGEVDIAAGLDSDDPLVCEVKLYDPSGSYRVPYVAKGFRQVLDYAHDYGKRVAYLVTFKRRVRVS